MGRGRAALRAVAELETFDADEIWEQMIRQAREAEGGGGRYHELLCTSASKSSIRRFVITEKAPTRALS